MPNSNTPHSRALRQRTAGMWAKEKRRKGERVYFPSVLMTPKELDEIKKVIDIIKNENGGGARVALLALVRKYKECTKKSED